MSLDVTARAPKSCDIGYNGRSRLCNHSWLCLLIFLISAPMGVASGQLTRPVETLEGVGIDEKLDEPLPLEGSSVRGNQRPEDLVGDYEPRDVESVCAGLIRTFPQF